MPSVVLVEGRSDEAAVRAVAARLGREVEVVVCGGAGGFRRALADLDVGAAAVGLCDAGEAADVRRAGLEEPDLFVCHADLEDELIRALGTEEVVEVIRSAGDIHQFRSFQDQPFQRERPLDAQLRRFLGTKSGRKIRYGVLLVEALPLAAVPGPLGDLVSRL